MPGVRSERQRLSGIDLIRWKRRVAQALLQHVAMSDLRTRFGCGEDTIRDVAGEFGIDMKTRKIAKAG
jgi:hypothetical protein